MKILIGDQDPLTIEEIQNSFCRRWPQLVPLYTSDPELLLETIELEGPELVLLDWNLCDYAADHDAPLGGPG